MDPDQTALQIQSDQGKSSLITIPLFCSKMKLLKLKDDC